MTLLGLGDIQNPKHYLIPAAIIAVGISMGLIMSSFEYAMNPDMYNLLFFPLALVAGFAAKFWIDGFDPE